MSSISYQHMYMMHQVQGKQGQFHDKICVVDVSALALPCSFMVEIPEMNYISARARKLTLFLFVVVKQHLYNPNYFVHFSKNFQIWILCPSEALCPQSVLTLLMLLVLNSNILKKQSMLSLHWHYRPCQLIEKMQHLLKTTLGNGSQPQDYSNYRSTFFST